MSFKALSSLTSTEILLWYFGYSSKEHRRTRA